VIQLKGLFSVLISVYDKEQHTYLDRALSSMVNQTLLPAEIVLVEDGLLTPELRMVISGYCAKYPALLKIVKLDNNVGLGLALAKGLEFCTQDVVIRMDSDDICVPDRFEKLYNFLNDHHDISVVGSVIEEFNFYPGDLKKYRRLPIEPQELVRFAKFRNPLNHPSVAFRKQDILKIGGYLNMPLFEDYYLWVRLLVAGYKIANISESLLYFRIGNNMVGRRHGMSYLKKEWAFLQAIKNLNFISNFEYTSSLCLRSPMRLIPRNTLALIYKVFLR
jgi:glycosyltransferase involved in cell wall biosynthesis